MERERAETEAREKQERIDGLFHHAELGRRFSRRTFATFEERPGTEEALRLCRDLVDRYQAWREEGKGILLVGGVGSGKTHLAAACVRGLTAQAIPCLFVPVPEYLDRLRLSYRKDHQDTEQVEHEAASVAVVVLDDLGSERSPSDERGDWARERLYVLVNSRYEALRPTIITTNCDRDALEARLGARLVDRLDEMCVVAPIEASSYRKTQWGKMP